MRKKAIIYTRVSTDEQADRGFSLRDQKDRLEKYCEYHDIDISMHFQEDYSAKNFNRPEFKKLMVYLQRNKKDINMLLFVRWDRFSRNVMDAYNMIRKLNDLSVEPKAIDQPYDSTIPEQKMMLSYYLTLPEIENERRSLNVTAGMRRAMKEGRWPRQAPIGYRNARDEENRKIISVNSSIAPLIVRAFTEMAKGDKTQQDIRLDLKKQGLKCCKNNFSVMLKNEFYIGNIFIPAYRDEPVQTVEGIHEPIISRNLFYKVQSVLSSRNKKRNLSGKRVAKPEFPLRGFMLCNKCGGKMTGSASKGNGGKYHYYHCNKCGTRFSAPDANVSFEKLLQKLVFKDDVKKLFKLAVTRGSKAIMEEEQKDLKTVGVKLKRQKERNSCLNSNFLDGHITGRAYTDLKKVVDEDLFRLTQIEQELKQMKNNFTIDLSKGIDAVFNIRNIYDRSDIEGKQRVIGSIFPRKFVFEENKVRTEDINEVVRWVMNSGKALLKTKKGQPKSKFQLSPLVNPAGFEPATS